MCVCVCACVSRLRKFLIVRLIESQQKSSVTTRSLCDHPLSLVIIIAVIAIILLLAGENFLGKWELGGSVL